jgi:replicative DNA helicase
MTNRKNKVHSNEIAEMMVLAIIYNYPSEFSIVERSISKEDFTTPIHKELFRIFQYLYNKDFDRIGKEHILSAVIDLEIDADKFRNLTEEGYYLDKILYTGVDGERIEKWASLIAGETYKRRMSEEFRRLYMYVNSTSDEIDDIINYVENSVVAAGEKASTDDYAGEQIFGRAREFIRELAEDPINGIDVRLPIWQKSIGLLRNKTVHFVVGYTGTGKSQFALRAALLAAKKVPVVYCDTEMDAEMAIMRGFCIIHNVPYDFVEYGYWHMPIQKLKDMGIDDETVDQIQKCKRVIENEGNWKRFQKIYGTNFMYLNIIGVPLSQAFKHIRRILLSKIKDRNPDSKHPQAFIVIDQIKVSDPQELKEAQLQEWQQLGFEMSRLHDFANAMNVPVLCMGQTNAGGEVEGSKRLKNTATSVTIFHRKTLRDFKEDKQGNYKLILNKSRRGGVRDGAHINCIMQPERGFIEEVGIGGIKCNDQEPEQSGELKLPDDPGQIKSKGSEDHSNGDGGMLPNSDASGG